MVYELLNRPSWESTEPPPMASSMAPSAAISSASSGPPERHISTLRPRFARASLPFYGLRNLRNARPLWHSQISDSHAVIYEWGRPRRVAEPPRCSAGASSMLDALAIGALSGRLSRVSLHPS